MPQLALSCDVRGLGWFKSEVVSGLQCDDEQDRGSEAQPDIAGISTRDAERMLSAGEERNYKALSHTLREGKG